MNQEILSDTDSDYETNLGNDMCKDTGITKSTTCIPQIDGINDSETDSSCENNTGNELPRHLIRFIFYALHIYEVGVNLNLRNPYQSS